MAEIVKMPKLSDTMTEGVVSKWHKEVGDQVESGELLAEIETDKATMEFESFQDGILLHKGVEEGNSAPVDSILAIFGKKGEKYDHLLTEAAEAATTNEGNNAPKEAEQPAQKGKQEKIDVSGINAEIVRMPKLSDTMTEGTIAKWHKKVGDKVQSGELLAEIETDKATMEFESFEEGILLYQGVGEGKSSPVDSVLAVIGDNKADYQKLLEAEKQTAAAEASEEKETVAAAPTGTTTEKTQAEAAPVARSVMATSGNGRIKASPLAKRLAEEKNISLAHINGTGDGGRIIKRDIENYTPAGGGYVGTGLTTESYEEIDVSQMRKTIARRLGESKFNAPHFYLTIQIDMDNAISARKAIIEAHEQKFSFNDLVIKAAAAALMQHSMVNASWQGDKIRINKHVNIGVAVAVEEGLVVPVVRYPNTKSLFQVNQEVRQFAEQAKNKKLQPQDMEGSTFTISNLGMFGIDEFTAIINSPDACILAVGNINQVPVVKDGQIVPGNMMKVTLSCDHRVVDGAKGAEFLATFKKYMENPITLFV